VGLPAASGSRGPPGGGGAGGPDTSCVPAAAPDLPGSSEPDAFGEIATGRLRLRPFREEDLAAFVAYRSEPEVARFQSWDASYAMPDAEAFLAVQRETAFGTPGRWAQLAMVERATGTLCGDCAVHVVTGQPATAEVGVTLAPWGQGRGLATEALRALVTDLFERRGMHRVFADVDDLNLASRRLFERLGFRCEARLVEADWFKDAWTTLRTYAVLAREWPQPTRPADGARASPPEA
jgi:RimJ/RimL family protein N-acetyltransferase